jgi:hypothetical protein
MITAVKRTVWANESACSEGDGAGIDEDCVDVYVDTFADSGGVGISGGKGGGGVRDGRIVT